MNQENIKHRRVLLVDDNIDFTDFLGMLFEAAGHLVRVAHTGASGLVEARTFQPEIILCDISLGAKMNGYDFARAIRQDSLFQGVRLIALTGYSEDQYRKEALQSGFDLLIVKPGGLKLSESLVQQVCGHDPIRADD